MAETIYLKNGKSLSLISGNEFERAIKEELGEDAAAYYTEIEEWAERASKDEELSDISDYERELLKNHWCFTTLLEDIKQIFELIAEDIQDNQGLIKDLLQKMMDKINKQME